jgi:hypothetical protein
MPPTLTETIRELILRWEQGHPFTVADVTPSGTPCRLVRRRLRAFAETKWIIRLSEGIYYLPRFSSILGCLVAPLWTDYAEVWARRRGETLTPCRAALENGLGYSTQVVARCIMITSARKGRTLRLFLTKIELRPFHEEWPEGVPAHLQRPYMHRHDYEAKHGPVGYQEAAEGG